MDETPKWDPIPTLLTFDPLYQLVAAARDNDIKTLYMLMRHGVLNKHQPQRGLNIALCWSITNANFEMTRLLLIAGAEINNTVYGTRMTPLLIAFALPASLKNKQEIIRLLIFSGAKRHYSDSKNENALNYAAFANDVSAIDLALSMGLSINPDTTKPPLHTAVLNKNIEAVKYLLSLGANPLGQSNSIYKNTTPIHIALDQNDFEIAKTLLEKIPKESRHLINSAHYYMRAIDSYSLDHIQNLYDMGLEINAKGWVSGISCLSYATSRLYGYQADEEKTLACISKLLSLGANMYARDKYGDLPITAKYTNSKILGLYKEHGFDFKKYSYELLCHAIKTNNSLLLVNYLAAGVDVNEPSKQDNSTALHYAAERGKQKICQDLLDYGAQPDVRDKYGETAFDRAIKNGKTSTARTIKKYMGMG